MRRSLFLAFLVCSGWGSPARAYVGGCPTLGKIIKDSTHIVAWRVDKVSQEKRAIIFKKQADLKGQFAAEEIKHQVGDGWHPREPQLILDWAEPGQVAIAFTNGATALVCIGHYWYECQRGEGPWWNMSHGCPELSLSYYGTTGKLRGSLVSILKGQETPVTALSGGNLAQDAAFTNVLRGKDRPIRRIKVTADMPGYLYQLTIPPNWDPDPRYIIPGAGGTADVPPLVEALKHQEWRARAEAAQSLGWIGPPAKVALPALGQTLKDVEGQVRVRAAEALARIDADNQAALPALTETLKDRDVRVRKAAADALGDLGTMSRPAVAALAGALKDPELKVRWAAAEALGQIGSQAEAGVPALVEALKDESLRGAAADALGAMGHAARPAVPALADVLKQSKGTTRWTVALALARIGGPGSGVAAPVIAEALKGHPDSNRACWNALLILEVMGPDAKDAVPALLEIVKLDTGQTFATGVLWKIDPKASIPYQIRDLKRGNELEKKYHAFQLGVTGPDAKDAIPILTEMARAGGSVGRISAWAAEMVRGDYKAAAPLLLAGLKDSDNYVSNFSTQTLERFGPQAKAAVPVLIEALADKTPRVRATAAATLGRIGPEAGSAVPAVQKAARDDNPEVAAAATTALKKIQAK